jgi:hypothetical protein
LREDLDEIERAAAHLIVREVMTGALTISVAACR